MYTDICIYIYIYILYYIILYYKTKSIFLFTHTHLQNTPRKASPQKKGLAPEV